MNILLREIIARHIIMRKDSPVFDHNRAELKEQLSADGRKLLLRIIDEKDALVEQAALRNFEKGFRLGAEFGADLFGARPPRRR